MLARHRDVGFPGSDYELVLAARLWRRSGETELSLQTLRNISSGSEAIDLATYEAARVWLEASRDGPGARAYWSICGSSDDRVRAEIAWDLLPVTTPKEREEWPKVAVGQAPCEWLQSLWAERASRIVVPIDERLALHFGRMAEARHRYRLAKVEGRATLVRAHTLAERNASTRVLEKCGFGLVGEVVDPEDGPVWRWERTATALGSQSLAGEAQTR